MTIAVVCRLMTERFELCASHDARNPTRFEHDFRAFLKFSCQKIFIVFSFLFVLSDSLLPLVLSFFFLVCTLLKFCLFSLFLIFLYIFYPVFVFLIL